MTAEGKGNVEQKGGKTVAERFEPARRTNYYALSIKLLISVVIIQAVLLSLSYYHHDDNHHHQNKPSFIDSIILGKSKWKTHHETKSYSVERNLCHPPMTPILSHMPNMGVEEEEDDDLNKSLKLSKHPEIISASEWTREYLNQVRDSNLDNYNTIAVSIFAPHGDEVFQLGLGKVRNDDERKYEDHNNCVNGASIYRMASITKLFPALELFILQERGLLDLDDDISNLIPGYKYPSKTWGERLDYETSKKSNNNHHRHHQERCENHLSGVGKITCRQLISHLSGTIRDFPIDQDLSNGLRFVLPSTSKEVLEGISNTSMILNPSTYPIYSNMGFILAGYVAENVDYEARKKGALDEHHQQQVEKINIIDLIQRDILGPLNMTTSFFNIPNDRKIKNNIVIPHDKSTREWIGFNLSTSNSAGGLYSTNNDLAKFGQTILSLMYRNDYEDDDDNGENGKNGVESDMKKVKSTLDLSPQTIRDWLRPLFVYDDHLTAVGAPWEIFNFPPPETVLSPKKHHHRHSKKEVFELNNVINYPRNMRLFTKSGTLPPGIHTDFFLDPAREFGGSMLVTGTTPSLLRVKEAVAKRFAIAFDRIRSGLVIKQYAGRYNIDEKNLNPDTNDIGARKGDYMKLGVMEEDATLWITEWIQNGTDILATWGLKVNERQTTMSHCHDTGLFCYVKRKLSHHCCRHHNDHHHRQQSNQKNHSPPYPGLPLWPTSEKGIYRYVVGDSGLTKWDGCFMQMARIDMAFVNGFPIDLIKIDENSIHVPSAKLTFFKE